ncbi:MAG TPA: polysaccharide ABC transporter ATP-binding protein [Pyrinomonadaceae bacterium]|jgi:lipopolysaccharide transport system ATP-binding protein
MSHAIRVKELSKCYRIGGLDAGYATFREMVAVALAKPFRRLRGHQRAPGEMIWALKDVDFDVQPGEVVGLIGHNGAGKSTLLKILSRITVPTKGRTEVYGKMGSLLEIGTGFHPDLTGRENIYLSGAILGISRAEVARRFEEVVEFSGIEQFIDTPVKWYSSGMYLRLAFAVAAHLETEVLVMDEVLAVGDVSFQQKCLDKMHEIRSQGRTILFVSHSMAAVTRLCKRVILLEKGLVVNDGPAHEVVNRYLGSNWQLTATREWDDAHAPGNEVVRMRTARVRNPAGETTESIDIRHEVGVELGYEVLQPGHVLAPKVDLYNEGGVHVFSTHDVTPEWLRRPRPQGHYLSTVWIPGNFLSEGNMIVYASIVSHTPVTALHANAPHAVTFQVVDNQNSDSARGNYIGTIPGVVRPLLNWTTDFQEGAGA